MTQRAGGVAYRARLGALLRVATPTGAIVTASGAATLRVVVRDRRALDGGRRSPEAPDADDATKERDAMWRRGQIVGLTALAGAAALIAVIEGRATVARGTSSVGVDAGEVAVVDDEGARRVDRAEGAEALFAAGADPEKPAWPSRDPAVRAALRAEIMAALKAPAASDPAPPGSPAVAAAPIAVASTDASVEFEPSYIRARVREDFMPLGAKCYEDALASRPALHGRVIVHFKIVGDEKVGGIVDEATIDEKSTLKDAAMTECIRQSMMTVSFAPPPHGGWSTVTYPFIFSPGEDGGDDE